MLLAVYFISFFLFCHQTGQYIVRITERIRYYQPIFLYNLVTVRI